ncbi:MAG: cation-translocating P-type ATPase [Planctomycetes bacterium]|nr:cation-translocating P-type ATPase [Planctomycetota bacterium]
MRDTIPSASEPSGLSDAEAATRLAADGPNALQRDEPTSLWRSVFEVVREPMLLLLLAAGGIYLVLGDREEALTLLSFVVVVITITLVQERKTERALAALRDLSSPRALVVRDGRRKRIAGREVVRGDVLVLAEGDRIAADARLFESTHLEVDESLLTGESMPVRKRVGGAQVDDPRPGGDDQPFVYAGTLVVRGHGLAEVRAIGAKSEMGRIGAALVGLESGRTPLQIEVGRIVRTIAVIGIVLCLALVVVYGLTRGDWLQGVLAGIALAMAVLPEEFPVVLTVFMALGAWRLSKIRVLARRLPAVEALGAATVLCSDKTGTLTENRMRIAELATPATRHVVAQGSLPEAVHEVLEFGVLASQRDPFDPMEQAFHRLAKETLAGTEHLHDEWRLVREYPLSSELLAVSHVWRSPDGERLVVAAKGAPEAIADICHLDAVAQARVQAALTEMGAKGLRVLAVARAWFGATELPAGQHDFDFELVGLVGLEDPVRAGVPAAVAECAEAGVRVVMITGDSPDTARAIARSIGLPSQHGVITGKELEALSDDELSQRVAQTSVFARVVPEQKLRLVQTLRARGEVVAMTGDGVNDAPALKAAHIGVAMGGRGTDVARESAALVVTDDDFTSIVGAVRLGRRIYDNLRRAMAYVVAVHVPIAGLSLLPVLFGWPLVLFPVHIVFLELLIDPACSVAFEAEPAADDVMRRPPRRVGAGLFDRRLLGVSLVQGACLLAVTLTVFGWSLRQGEAEGQARALAFAALIAGNVALILVNRSWQRGLFATLAQKNTAAWVVVVGAAATLTAALSIPFLRGLFKFDEVALASVALAVLLGFASLAWFEALKFFQPKWLVRA